MIYLKNYKESVQDTNNNLFNDCLICFADTIDNNDCKVDRFNTTEKEVRLWFKRKPNVGLDGGNGYSTIPSDIDEMILQEEEYLTLLNDVKTGISRLKDIHPGLKLEIHCASTLTEIFFSL